jgi:hypothetical protein
MVDFKDTLYDEKTSANTTFVSEGQWTVYQAYLLSQSTPGAM